MPIFKGISTCVCWCLYKGVFAFAGLKLMRGIILDLSKLLSIETKSLIQTQNSLVLLVLLARLFWRCSLFFSQGWNHRPLTHRPGKYGGSRIWILVLTLPWEAFLPLHYLLNPSSCNTLFVLTNISPHFLNVLKLLVATILFSASKRSIILVSIWVWLCSTHLSMLVLFHLISEHLGSSIFLIK